MKCEIIRKTLGGIFKSPSLYSPQLKTQLQPRVQVSFSRAIEIWSHASEGHAHVFQIALYRIYT